MQQRSSGRRRDRRGSRLRGLKDALGLVCILLGVGACDRVDADGSGGAAEALLGSWQFVEDRTAPEHGRDPRERPPLGGRFRVALDGSGVVVEHVRRGATFRTRVALDGSEDVQQAGATTRTTAGRIEGGVLAWEERLAGEHAGRRQTTTTAFTLTPGAEGLLVRMQLREPVQLERTALYRRAEDLPAPKAVKGDLGALAWLAGRFTATGTGDGGKTMEMEEHWGPAGGGAMLGTARTVAGGRMVSFEFLRIVERDGSLVYVAQPGGGPAVEFVLTELSATRALFENPQHDYPKRVLYERLPAPADGRDGLRTEISDTGGAGAHAATYRRAP